MQVDIPHGTRAAGSRVHAAYAEHPLLGDASIATASTMPSSRAPGSKRKIFLHAQSITYDWPGSGVPVHASAPLPLRILAAVLDADSAQRRSDPQVRARRAARLFYNLPQGV